MTCSPEATTASYSRASWSGERSEQYFTSWFVTPDMADFASPGPARFWVFTLKALAFIRLRKQDPDAARAYLAKVQELDPEGGSGASVIEALIKGSQG